MYGIYSFLSRLFHYRFYGISSTLLVISVISMGSCAKEEQTETSPYPDLNIYLKRFEEEALKRGYDFDLSGVDAVYVDAIFMQVQSYCGYGYPDYETTGQRRIEIAKVMRCDWINLTDIEREQLFFHEIGHAFLNRTHDNTYLCDNAPASLMTSTRNIYRVYDEDEPDKRDYYIAELIDRLAANEKCIQFSHNWPVDSSFYRVIENDENWYLVDQEGKYSGSREGTSFVLASQSNNAASGTGYWWRSFDNPNIPECATVKLKVTLNSSHLKGTGAAIAIRSFYNEPGKTGATFEQYTVESTEDEPLSGKIDDQQMEITLDCFTRKIERLAISMVMLPDTEGSIHFTDIQLVVVEP